MSTPDSEFALAKRAAEGDTAALTVLLQQARPGLIRSVAANIPHNAVGVIDAEDIVQDGLISAFKHIGEFQAAGPGSFHRWLETIMENRLHDTECKD